MTTTLPSASLEGRLAAQEADPYHIPAARQALEEAVVAQFRELARGLFADMLLRGETPNEDAWWYQYASLHQPTTRPAADDFAAGLEKAGSLGFRGATAPPGELQFLFQTLRGSWSSLYAKQAMETDREIPEFQAFRKSFPTDVALRRVRVISPAEALETRIRIYGGTVDLWQEGRINRQLSDLGSNIRYTIEGARQHRMDKVRAVVGQPAAAPEGTPNFVLGECAPTSAVGRALFLEIEREFAVSPYLGSAPGYAEGMKAVVRRSVPWRLIAIDPGGHELYHALTAEDQGSGLTSWHAVLRDDLCRFCQTPRTFEKIAYEFSRVFGFNMAVAVGVSQGPLSANRIAGDGYPPGESPAQVSLYGIVERLCEDGLLVLKDGAYYCSLFEEGRRWHLA